MSENELNTAARDLLAVRAMLKTVIWGRVELLLNYLEDSKNKFAQKMKKTARFAMNQAVLVR